MARRVSAMIGILLVVALALALMWTVYRHHRASGGDDEEPGVIARLNR